MKEFFILANDAVRINAIEAIKKAPQGHIVEIKPKNRSLEQNALLHTIIQKISLKVEWAGKKRAIDTWKRLLTAGWLRARGESIEILPSIDYQGVDIVFRHTSHLTVAEMSEFIEYIMAFAVEHGIDP